MMNRVILVGRLTRDPDLKSTLSGVSVASFTIAVDRPYVNQQTGDSETDFIPVVVWRKQADNVSKFLKKGKLVGVDGRIQTRSYNDKDGTKRYVTEVVADNVAFLEPKGSQQDGTYSNNDYNKKEQSIEESVENVTYSNEDLPY